MLPLKDSLDLWLEIEQTYVTERINSSMSLPGAMSLSGGKEPDDFKIVTDMPVEQLVYFRRLEIEVDKAPKPNLTRFCKFVAKTYSTTRKENVSENYVRLCYYNFTLTTQNRVEDRLYEMIRRSKGM